MFGQTNSSVEDVGDVVVKDAHNVTIDSPEDVRIAPDAVAGTLRIVNMGDVYIESTGAHQPASARDFVVDDGDDADITDCEDVEVTSGSVAGDLTIRHSYDDVYLQTTAEVEFADVEDVFVQANAISSTDSVRIAEAEDVWIRDGAIDGLVTAIQPEDILQKSEAAVSRDVNVATVDEEGSLHIVESGDILVETGGVHGTLIAADPDDVYEDVSF